jgi:hypothetical protein
MSLLLSAAAAASAQDEEEKPVDEGFVSQDQSGNDPREFTSKFMPYYRYTELENNLEVQEFVAFGFFAFTGRFGMTYEVPVGKYVDYEDVDTFRTATAGGCPPSGGSLPPIGSNPGGGGGIALDDLDCGGSNTGLGDSIFRFFLRPQQLEFGYMGDKNFSIIPTLEFTAPTATQDVLGGEALILSPAITLVFDTPVDVKPFSLGFFAIMNFYDFDLVKSRSESDTSRYRGRYFWMQPLSKPTEEFNLLDLNGLYVMTEAQPVYDFKESHFSFWIGPEFGKIPTPGHVFYFKPGFGIQPDGKRGDRKLTFEAGYRFFF